MTRLPAAQLESLIPRRTFDDQLAAVVGLDRRQEQGKGDVRSDPSHQCIIHMQPIGVTRLVAGEQRSDDGLGAGRQRKHRMLAEPPLDQAARRLRQRPLARLQVGLDASRRPSRRLAAVVEGGVSKSGANSLKVCGVE